MTKTKSKKNSTPQTNILEELRNNMSYYFSESKVITTNIPIVDKALCGGLELGSIVQLVGESSTGKSTLVMQIVSNLCKQNKKVLYIDSEGSVSKGLLEELEIYNDSNFLYVRENEFKKVEDIIDNIINSNECSFIVVDSLACLIHEGFTNIEKNKKISITTNNTSYSSKALTAFMHKYNAIAKLKNICFIMINQYRNKVDMKQGTIQKIYGAKNVVYNCDCILNITPIKQIGDNAKFKSLTENLNLGIALNLEIVKSNKKSPKQKYPYYLVYGKGISYLISSIYALIQLEIIKVESNGYYFIKDHKAHGINELYNLFVNQVISLDEFQNDIENYYQNL